MEGAYLGLGQLAQGNLLGHISEGDHAQGVTRKLRANEVGEGQRHPLGRREAILAVEEHGVGDVQHEHGSARRPILGLVHHEVLVFQIERHPDSLPLDGAFQRRRHVEVERVSELVGLARSVRLHACGEVRCLMRAETGLAKRREEISECPIPQEVHPLLSEFELYLLGRLPCFVDLPHSGDVLHRSRHGRSSVLQRDVSLLDYTLDEVVQKIRDLLLDGLVTLALTPELVDHLGCELAALHERLEKRVLERLDGVGVLQPGPSPIGMVVRPPREPPVHQEVRQELHEVLEVQSVEPTAPILGVGRETHVTVGERETPYPPSRVVEGRAGGQRATFGRPRPTQYRAVGESVPGEAVEEVQWVGLGSAHTVVGA